MQIFSIMPCAGSGKRFYTNNPMQLAQAKPKQYLTYQGKALFLHALETICAYFMQASSFKHHAYVATQSYDNTINFYQDELKIMPVKITKTGGETRFETVFNTLQIIAKEHQLSKYDLILVHDAARPNLHKQDLHALVTKVIESKVQPSSSSLYAGAILVKPISDTIKVINTLGQITHTIDRNAYMLAQTPQLFRFDVLYEAFQLIKQLGLQDLVTDEASCIEQLNLEKYKNLNFLTIDYVVSQFNNDKITYAQDMPI